MIVTKQFSNTINIICTHSNILTPCSVALTHSDFHALRVDNFTLLFYIYSGLIVTSFIVKILERHSARNINSNHLEKKKFSFMRHSDRTTLVRHFDRHTRAISANACSSTSRTTQPPRRHRLSLWIFCCLLI